GWVIVNPTFERQFEWIESEVFEIVGTHLGYNVDAIRKQMVTACNTPLYGSYRHRVLNRWLPAPYHWHVQAEPTQKQF
ncbi:hypothetical protein EOK95_25990, partial [Enterobacter hormaechei]